ncbi:ATPase [Bacteroidia bacterium]|nr:ATPase [Bacteroidia bacterium]
MEIIGRVAATEKIPTTIDDFYFWTSKDRILNPFDVVKVEHINESKTFGVIEEISHITDTPSYLTSFISSDFGDVNCQLNTQRIGMNFVKAKVVRNTKDIYIPVRDGSSVEFADKEEIAEALGLKDVKNKLVGGYIEMYEYDEKNKTQIPVHFNSHFLIGPEGVHLNISGISGLASKTSYAMFLMKAIQDQFINQSSNEENESVAMIMLNVKGRDLLAIDEVNTELSDKDKDIYKMLELKAEPFKQVQYFYPYSENHGNTSHRKEDVEHQVKLKKAHFYKYLFEEDKESIELLFANVEDPQQTMESINNYIIQGNGLFNDIRNWNSFKDKVNEYCQSGSKRDDKEITVASWRKFKRIINTALTNQIFGNTVSEQDNEVRLKEAISNIRKNDIFVIDVAKLDDTMQGFVFGDVMRTISELKDGQIEGIDEKQIPSKIIIFIDELNKYASSDVRNSPILKQIIDISERGRTQGIVLFSAEQFKSAIHDRVTGNCSTHAYGRTNAIEVSKKDYQFIPQVYKGMMTRLIQGQYLLQNPVFRSLLNIKFPMPLYRQFK